MANMSKEKVFIGCDNAGVAFKNDIRKFIETLGYEVEDLSVPGTDDPTPYADVAERVTERIAASGFKLRGVLICGTGIGMAIAANKVKGIRAAQAHDTFSAERAALSNDCHILTMGARVIGVELGKKIVKEWLGLRFVPGPSSEKIEAIMRLEAKGC